MGLIVSSNALASLTSSLTGDDMATCAGAAFAAPPANPVHADTRDDVQRRQRHVM